jgi:serine protease
MKSFSTLRHTALMAAMVLIMPAVHATDMQQQAASKISTVSSQETDSYDKFIISYREGSGIRNNPSEVVKDVQFAITASGVDRTGSRSATDLQPLVVTYKRKLGIGAELVQTSRKLGMVEANALMQKIAANPDVVYVEPDRKLRIEGAAEPTFPSLRSDAGRKALFIAPLAFAPDDPYYQRQWNFYLSGVANANIDKAWDLASGDGVTVAVIDTGIAPNPDLDDTFVCDGYNFVSDDGPDRDKCGRDPGYPESSGTPSSWHGTKVAGVINAKTNNGIGVAGVAYNARLIPIRAADHIGVATSEAADAIEWVSGGHVDGIEDAKYPAQVINMSFGNYRSGKCEVAEPALAQAIQRAIARNVVIVASAGNDGVDGTANNHVPSTCPGVVAVAASDYSFNRAAYSNYGAAVALAAPVGDGIGNPDQMYYEWSWLLSNSGTYGPIDDAVPRVAPDVGTSFAAPMVTGTVALMISARHNAGLPIATPAQIKAWLTSSARPITPDRPIGSGLLDAHAAVVKAITE